jgi:hypothetical protein
MILNSGPPSAPGLKVIDKNIDNLTVPPDADMGITWAKIGNPGGRIRIILAQDVHELVWHESRGHDGMRLNWYCLALHDELPLSLT